MYKIAVIGLLGLTLASCAHSRYKASFEQLCLQEGKEVAYCAAWADVEAHKLVSQNLGRHTTAVVIPMQ